MNGERIHEESTVVGDQATIPDRVRRELGIEDGDQLRWVLEPDGSVRIRVVSRQTGAFADLGGYDAGEVADVIDEHNSWSAE